MKRKLQALFLACLPFLSIMAEPITPYVMDFSSIVEGDGGKLESDFVPGTGWSHIVSGQSSYSGMNYLPYTSHATGGVDDGAYLQVGGLFSYSSYTYTNPGDALVTPPVSGEISISARKTSGNYYSPSVKIYKVSDENGVLTLGDEIRDIPADSIVSSEFRAFTSTISESQRVAIVAANVDIDEFTAATADITKQRKLKISSVAAPALPYADTDSKGNYSVTFKVTVKNVGDYDLSSTDEGFTVSLVDSADHGKVYATAPIAAALPVGAKSDTISLTANISTTDYAPVTFGVMENISGTYADGAKITPLEYKAVPELLIPAASSYSQPTAIPDTLVLHFDKSKGDVTRSFLLRNNGAAPLKVTSVSVPEGFATSLGQTEVAPHATIDFTLTMKGDVKGNKEGQFVLKTESGDFNYNIDGYTVYDDSWFADFESGSMPADMLVEGDDGYQNWRVRGLAASYNRPTNGYIVERTCSEDAKLISPLLVVGEGESLTFSARKSTNMSHLTVYYSQDRKNWIKADSVGSDPEKFANVFSDVKVADDGYSPSYELKDFTVSNIPAGQYYVAFAGGNGVGIDDIYGFTKADVKHDFIITAQEIPSAGTVNSVYDASVTFKNNTTNREDASTYKARLYFGDNVLAETDGVKVDAGETATVSFEATPHKSGSFKARIELLDGDYAVSSDTVDVAIAEEQAVDEKQIGEIYSGSSYVPIAGQRQSESEFVYTPSVLKKYGLKKGDRISKISFLGYNSYSSFDIAIKAGVENTTDTAAYDYPYALKDSTLEQKLAYNDVYTMPVVGSSYPEKWDKLFTITFDEPFVYDGNGLLFYMSGDVQNGAYGSSSFAYDKNVNGYVLSHRVSYYGDWDSWNTSDARGIPVITVELSKEAKDVSGTVTDAATGNAIEGADVTLTSRNIEYSDSTKADGSYNLSVKKDDLIYTLSAVKAGYLPYEKDSVSVADGNLAENISLQAAHNLYVKSFVAPDSVVANYGGSAVLTVLNPFGNGLTASDYTVTLTVDGEPYATAGSRDIASLGEASFSVPFVFNEAGSHELAFEVKYGDDVARSAVKTVKVLREQLGATVQLLDSTTCSSDGGPAYLVANSSRTETIYNADQIGLVKGARITRLQYKGYVSGYGSVDLKSNIKVWIENTSLTSDDIPQNSDAAYGDIAFKTTGVEPVFNDTVHFVNGGRADSLVVLLDIPVNRLRYNGEGLRIIVENSNDETSYYVNWEAMATNQTMYKRTYQPGTDFETAGDWSRSRQSPVAFLTADNSATVYGTVVDYKGEPLAGATVTLQSGDVKYASVTGFDGTYEIQLAQPSLDYEAVFACDGYITDTVSVALSDDAPTEVNDTMYTKEALGINAVDGNAKKLDGNDVYTIDGQFIGHDVDLNSLRRGVYIIGRKKVVIK